MNLASKNWKTDVESFETFSVVDSRGLGRSCPDSIHISLQANISKVEKLLRQHLETVGLSWSRITGPKSESKVHVSLKRRAVSESGWDRLDASPDARLFYAKWVHSLHLVCSGRTLRWSVTRGHSGTVIGANLALNVFASSSLTFAPWLGTNVFVCFIII